MARANPPGVISEMSDQPEYAYVTMPWAAAIISPNPGKTFDQATSTFAVKKNHTGI